MKKLNKMLVAIIFLAIISAAAGNLLADCANNGTSNEEDTVCHSDGEWCGTVVYTQMVGCTAPGTLQGKWCDNHAGTCAITYKTVTSGICHDGTCDGSGGSSTSQCISDNGSTCYPTTKQYDCLIGG